MSKLEELKPNAAVRGILPDGHWDHRAEQLKLQEQAGKPNLPAPRPGLFFVYALRCEGGSHYIGQTDNLQRRWVEHVSGQGGEWTRKHKPRRIAHVEEYTSREEAVKREGDLKTGFGREWLKELIAEGRANRIEVPTAARQAGARLNSDEARKRADGLQARLQKRMEELKLEKQIAPLPPVVMGGVLVIPAGLLRLVKGLPAAQEGSMGAAQAGQGAAGEVAVTGLPAATGAERAAQAGADNDAAAAFPARAGLRGNERELQFRGTAEAGGGATMSNPTTFQVRDFTGGPFAVSAEDGEKLHDAIGPLLKAGKPVALSFAGIETVIGAFMGAAIGRLHGEMASEDVDALLSTRFLDGEQMESLKRVVANSKRYYENPGAYEAAWQEAEGTCGLAMIED